MATITRQPFAPLDGARLQALTSTKNRQIGVCSPASKRKAPVWTEADDSENVDPNQFAKRSKGTNQSSTGFVKKPAFTLTKAGSNQTFFEYSKLPSTSTSTSASSISPIPSSPRTVLKPRAPSTKIDSKANNIKTNSSPIRLSALSSSSSRSVIRGPRRGGILSSKRKAVSSLSRASPAPSNFGSAAPFSLDAALKGTFSSVENRLASSTLALPLSSPLDESGMSSSWFFDIHEDTPEQEMTNLLQHSTCVLDISSDEESEQKLRRERAEGRDKENIPPPNDISQRSTTLPEVSTDDMAVEKSRNPLSQLNAADFYAAGCDEASVVLIAADETEDTASSEQRPDVPDEKESLVQQAVPEVGRVDDPEVIQEKSQEKPETVASMKNVDPVDDIMTSRENLSSSAALLEPIEGTGESFQLWESGSQKGDDL